MTGKHKIFVKGGTEVNKAVLDEVRRLTDLSPYNIVLVSNKYEANEIVCLNERDFTEEYGKGLKKYKGIHVLVTFFQINYLLKTGDKNESNY